MFIFNAFSKHIFFLYDYFIDINVHCTTMHAPSMLMCAPLFLQCSMIVVALFLWHIIKVLYARHYLLELCLLSVPPHTHITNKYTTKFIIDRAFGIDRKLCSTIALIFIFYQIHNKEKWKTWWTAKWNTIHDLRFLSIYSNVYANVTVKRPKRYNCSCTFQMNSFNASNKFFFH